MKFFFGTLEITNGEYTYFSHAVFTAVSMKAAQKEQAKRAKDFYPTNGKAEVLRADKTVRGYFGHNGEVFTECAGLREIDKSDFHVLTKYIP